MYPELPKNNLYKLSVTFGYFSEHLFFNDKEQAEAELNKLEEVLKYDRFSNDRPVTVKVESPSGNLVVKTQDLLSARIIDMAAMTSTAKGFDEFYAKVNRHLNDLQGPPVENITAIDNVNTFTHVDAEKNSS